MAKLYFRYGAVSSAKTLNLLAVVHNYKQQGKEVLLLKPKIDTRFGNDIVMSRAGLKLKADIIFDDNTDLVIDKEYYCILVDEVQFASERIIEQLRDISIKQDIPIICYGLRTDFRTFSFPGSKRLFELADSIEEVKTTCSFCNKKAIFNMKLINGVPTLDGPSIELGAEEKYKPVCANCYTAEMRMT